MKAPGPYRQSPAARARSKARQSAAKDDAVTVCRLILDGKIPEARTLALRVVREMALSSKVV